MSTQYEYYDQLAVLVRALDNTTQNELQNSLNQSINDLNLEGSTFDHIVKVLGTPEEFFKEYIREMEKNRLKSVDLVRNVDSRLTNSYKILGLLQIVAIILPPIAVMNPIEGVPSIYILGIILTYALMMAAFILVYLLSPILMASNINLANFYYSSFKVLAIFLFANILTDDYPVNILLCKIGNVYFWVPLFFFIVIQLPVAIVSGLEFKVIRSKLSIIDKKEIFTLPNQLSILKQIKTILYVLCFLMLFVMPHLGPAILIGVIITTTLVLIIEGLLRLEVNLSDIATPIKEILIVNGLFTLQWYILKLVMEGVLEGVILQ